MLLLSQLAEMVKAQHSLNKVAAGSDYLDKGLAFELAAGIEGVEAIDHSAWKWWKGTEDDIPQMQMELVDILHFLISDTLSWLHNESVTDGSPISEEKLINIGSRRIESLLYATGKVYDTFQDTAFYGFLHEITAERQHTDLFEDLQYIRHFYALCNHIGLTSEELHYQYVAKNVLNLFRQANGYKEGTYVKTKWIDGTREDNEYLVQEMDKVKGTSNLNMDYLTTQLDNHYQQVLEWNDE